MIETPLIRVSLTNTLIMNIKNEYNSSRSGFSHTSRLYSDDDKLIATAKCFYINRTWESYAFRTSSLKVVDKAIEDEITTQKNLLGIKRLTKEKRQSIIDYSSTIQQLKLLYSSL